ncbi:MAG: hypothetical protein ACFE0P_03215 [Oceanicaulis sp.]
MSLDRFSLICMLIAALGGGAAVTLLLLPSQEPPALKSPQAGAVEPVNAAALESVLARLVPPRAEPAPAQPAETVSLRLIGMVRSDDGRLAMITDGARTHAVRPGDIVEGYTVEALEADSVRLATPRGPLILRLGAP